MAIPVVYPYLEADLSACHQANPAVGHPFVREMTGDGKSRRNIWNDIMVTSGASPVDRAAVPTGLASVIAVAAVAGDRLCDVLCKPKSSFLFYKVLR